jgi:CDGSH-type Zn-finger protein/uncharacterized Fe-S cluster protein YjdI
VTRRDYAANGLTVHWDSALCIHSGRCVAALPDVFRPTDAPWVRTDGADPVALRAAIDDCPSRALTYTLEGSTMTDENPTTEHVSITATEDGPYLVEGEVTITGADGSTIREGSKFFLCRCGHSNVKPFCDGSHKAHGFTDDGLGKRRKADSA